MYEVCALSAFYSSNFHDPPSSPCLATQPLLSLPTQTKVALLSHPKILLTQNHATLSPPHPLSYLTMCTDFTRKLQLLGEALGVDVSDRVRRLVLDGGGSVKLVVSGVTETDTVALVCTWFEWYEVRSLMMVVGVGRD